MSADKKPPVAFEKSIPRFWKDYSATLLRVTGSIALVLFVELQNRVATLNHEVSDLHRYSTQLIHHDEAKRSATALAADLSRLTRTSTRGRDLWRDQVTELETQLDEAESEKERQFQALERAIGELRIHFATLEQHPIKAVELPTPPPDENPSRDRRGNRPSADGF